MGDWDGGRLLSTLEGEFQAALAGEEEIAARDLAFSLAQDVPVGVDVTRRGGSLLLPDVRLPIEGIGHDFLAAGLWFVPRDRAVISLGGPVRPRPLAQVFLGVLRGLAREAARVVVGLGTGAELGGSIARANATHLVLCDRDEVAVPVAEVTYLRRVPGGSAGAL